MSIKAWLCLAVVSAAAWVPVESAAAWSSTHHPPSPRRAASHTRAAAASPQHAAVAPHAAAAPQRAPALARGRMRCDAPMLKLEELKELKHLIRCYGCGAELQFESPNEAGYVEQERYELKVTSLTSLSTSICPPHMPPHMPERMLPPSLYISLRCSPLVSQLVRPSTSSCAPSSAADVEH
mgnify:CR=1 FL=1